MESPFYQLALTQDQFAWDNPLRLLLTEAVRDEGAYLCQIQEFGGLAKDIVTYEDLKHAFQKCKLEKYRQELTSTRNVAAKIKESLEKDPCFKSNMPIAIGDCKQQGVLTEDMMKWVTMELGENPAARLVLYYKASLCGFHPTKFWEVAL